MATLKQKVGAAAVNRTVVANYEDSKVVHNTGTETIAGSKTFADSPLVPTVTDISDSSMKAASTAFVQSVVTKLIPVSGNSGTLSALDLATLKADERAFIEKDSNLVLHYVGTDEENKMRYTAVTKHTEDDEYVLAIYVDADTGEWEFKYKRMYVCRFPNVPPTTVPNPTGVTGPLFYSIVNDLLHLQWDGVTVASAGAIYLWDSFPTQYLPKNGKQQCVGGIAFDNGASNCFMYINPSGVRIRAWTTGKQYWGALTVHLEF